MPEESTASRWRTTPLTAWHEAAGARMGEFGGFWMPILYEGILEEHRRVRAAVGMFDVSHMAEFLVEGDGADALVDRLVTNWPSRLEDGQALYTPMCRQDGGTQDDLLVYRRGANRYLLVTNAGNRDEDRGWIESVAAQRPDRPAVRDVSDEVALIAVQGPSAVAAVESLAHGPVADIGYYHFREGVSVADVPALVSRTGYTGEDGFELYVAATDAPALWAALARHGVKPVGLGARDTLRLEARLPLYGHELARDVSPLEAALGSFVKWEKPGGFIGREALAAQRAAGPARRLVGLEAVGGIPRAGYAVTRAGAAGEGVVTSGTHSPTLEVPIAMALVPRAWGVKVGDAVSVAVRGRPVPAKVVKLPFYRRPS
jgi:aminomethyltransferase